MRAPCGAPRDSFVGMPEPVVTLVNVFAAGPGGGNPAPIVVEANEMTDEEMREVARTSGHESGFVRASSHGSDAAFELRFWVPNHEMSMCGHATVAAVWLLHERGMLASDTIRVDTRSGPVDAVLTPSEDGRTGVEISQPPGTVERLDESQLGRARLAEVLRIRVDQLAPLPVQNSRTSRIKTLIPLVDVAALDGLDPDYGSIEALCDEIGSTGLYPYARSANDARVFHARQFPKSSGYPEDAATGIAAAALLFGLRESNQIDDGDAPVLVRQGEAMGRPSEIRVRARRENSAVTGCWVGGYAELSR
jgi:PhzF family phenazine biosynthesis protein